MPRSALPMLKRSQRPGRAALWTILVVAALGVGGGSGFWGARYFGFAGASSGEAGGDASEQLYTCGMHPNVIQKGPGECPICHMNLTPLKQSDDDESASASGPRERKVLYWRAPMDPGYLSDKPGKSPMGMDLVPVYADASESATGRTIRIDPVTIQNMGVRTDTVRRGPLVRTIRTLGRIDYDEQTVTFVNTKFDGWIEKLYVDETGMQVERGQPLFDVYSPKLYQAQEEYLAALRGVQRLAESPLLEAREESERLVQDSIVQLQYFDVTDEQIEEIKRTGKSRKTLTINSSSRGIVTEKMVLEGMYTKPGMQLYTIADLSRVWVYVDIYEYQLPWVAVGQEATMRLSYVPDRAFSGRVVYVYPYLEKQTRVVKVRLEFENPTLELKPEMYANVMLYADLDRNAPLIPREAYIDSGTRKVVFVDRGEGKFQPRDIRVGVEAEDGMVEVTYGLDEGERIVVSGQFMLDAESKLKEAIAKMLEAQTSDEGAGATQDAARETGESGGGIPADAKYACPMETHPNQEDPSRQGAFFSAEPGVCDRCGMTLAPLDELAWVRARRAGGESEVAYTCPEHPHVFSAQRGECPRCGKPLEPFKVMYTCPDPEHAGVISAQAGACPDDGRPLTPYRGVWLSAQMASAYVALNRQVAEAAAYHCAVHPLAHSDQPGRCPICAGELVSAGAVADAAEAVRRSIPPAAKFVCPMHPEQAGAAAGSLCSICGMRLVSAGDLAQPTSAPAAVAAQMDYLMEHYLALQQRFSSDRSADVALHALGLVGAADEIIGHLGDPDVKLAAGFGEAARRLRAAALKTTGKDLEADRVTFVELGKAMRTMVEQVRPSAEQYPKIFIFHCPMTKGDWLQTSAEMANPFYGFKMLKCGELRATK